MTQIGSATITQQHDWKQQLARIRVGAFEVMRLPITNGFGNDPHMIDDMINVGVKTIILQVRDCQIDYDYVYHDFIQAGYQIKVRDHPDVHFYLEVGNEPDICGRDPESYIAAMTDTLTRLRPLFVNYHNLDFAAGLAVHSDYNRKIIGNTQLMSLVEAVAYHIYGDEQLWDHPEIWSFWKDGELGASGKKILLTEVGINGPIGHCRKAFRYHEFSEYAPKQRPETEAVCFWTVCEDPGFKSYFIDGDMAEVIRYGI